MKQCPATVADCWLLREFRALSAELVDKMRAECPDAAPLSPIAVAGMGIPLDQADHVLHWARSGAVVLNGMKPKLKTKDARLAWVLIGAFALGVRAARQGRV